MPSFRLPVLLIGTSSLAALVAAPLAAESALPQERQSEDAEERASYVPAANEVGQPASSDRFALFVPTDEPVRHRIDFENYDFILKNIVVSMGPSIRQLPFRRPEAVGTRIRQGHKSPYRLEGSQVMFLFMENDAKAAFSDYRRELEGITNTLDIASLPRNEQLAFWFNFHNIAMLEQLANNWPTREPAEIEIDGVPLNDAKWLTVRGIPISLRDIRENIVFANWKSPKVIYGFWRGEIGGPALEREAFTAANVNSLLDIAAEDFINSLRGTQKRGDRLDVSTLYDETRAFYFPDFETDVRAHLSSYANEEVSEILSKTSMVNASIRDRTIADLSGGARFANYLFNSTEGNPMFYDDAPSSRVPIPLWLHLNDRQRKLEGMARDDIPTGRVIFSNIDLPGDPPNKNAVE
ncbi:hypothetical protein NAP1_09892 [Erythrobacter sp. NAP1]|uniref:DUF547 domain-containing protein n=1 Tax=Erythrobacter sp. NAP1 TaxID=237727 RepID=UPI00006851CD|nr:DUF547 domain-containing protein [Erythrobacter sp. NAP1]EAQ27897.1 hypothetical protein NAP1_09892 [Erythrobacter sp. NAP1]